jgi:hypothetical protein
MNTEGKSMAVTAALKVQLLANDVIVAESDSSALWHSVFQAMENDETLASPASRGRSQDDAEPESAAPNAPRGRPSSDGLLDGFVKELQLDPAVVEGACGPSREAPYIQLDKHHWESLRKNTGERGPKALAPAVLAATLLVLWWKHAGQDGSPTISDIAPILGTIHLPAFNVRRSLENCRWLQLRGKAISLNPSRTSSAVTVARAYCRQLPLESEV